MLIEEIERLHVRALDEVHDPFADVMEDLSSAADWMEHAITALYQTGDIETLLDSLEEVASHLGVSLPTGPCRLQKIPNKKQ
ncbi:MAG: hypothetical protein Q8O94_03640 [bacterium]|nr:hypothetical protein [bacterium]